MLHPPEELHLGFGSRQSRREVDNSDLDAAMSNLGPPTQLRPCQSGCHVHADSSLTQEASPLSMEWTASPIRVQELGQPRGRTLAPEKWTHILDPPSRTLPDLIPLPTTLVPM